MGVPRHEVERELRLRRGPAQHDGPGDDALRSPNGQTDGGRRRRGAKPRPSRSHPRWNDGEADPPFGNHAGRDTKMGRLAGSRPSRQLPGAEGQRVLRGGADFRRSAFVRLRGGLLL